MDFQTKLNDVLCSTGVTQTQLHRLTGISKSAISQYCSGKNTPSDDRQRDIAEALGLEPDYFKADDTVAAVPAADGKIARLTIREVSKLMGLSRAAIANGLQDGVFPWGYAVRGRGEGWVYWINAKRFAEIEGVTI